MKAKSSPSRKPAKKAAKKKIKVTHVTEYVPIPKDFFTKAFADRAKAKAKAKAKVKAKAKLKKSAKKTALGARKVKSKPANDLREKKAKKKPIAKRAGPNSASIVPIDPKTGKLIKSPKGREVFYAIKDAKGKLTKLPAQYSQKFSLRDLEGMNASMRASGPKHFVVYEEMTAQIVTDAKGKPVYRTKNGKPLLDKDRKKIPERKTKITFAKATKAQKPVLIAGKKSRALDIGFQKRKRHERPTAANLIPMATQRKVWSQEIVLQGETLKEAFNQIQLPISLAEFKKMYGLSVRGRLKIAGAEVDVISFRTTVDVLANFAGDVSQAARFALADHGMRFTSLVKLEEFADEDPDNEDAYLLVGRSLIPAASLTPIIPEFAGRPTLKPTSKKAPRVSVVLSVEPL